MHRCCNCHATTEDWYIGNEGDRGDWVCFVDPNDPREDLDHLLCPLCNERYEQFVQALRAERDLGSKSLH